MYGTIGMENGSGNNIMKIYQIIRASYDYAEFRNSIVGIFKESDLAEYISDELNKKFGNEPFLSYSVQEVWVFEDGLENWERVYKILENEELE
jgi:hypothetical protein